MPALTIDHRQRRVLAPMARFLRPHPNALREMLVSYTSGSRLARLLERNPRATLTVRTLVRDSQSHVCYDGVVLTCIGAATGRREYVLLTKNGAHSWDSQSASVRSRAST